MKVGVKFCGGCNPHYPRGEAYKRIASDLPEIDFGYAEEDENYDQLLVIGGCTACCPAYDQYKVNDEVFKMWSEEHIEEIEKKIKRKIK